MDVFFDEQTAFYGSNGLRQETCGYQDKYWSILDLGGVSDNNGKTLDSAPINDSSSEVLIQELSIHPDIRHEKESIRPPITRVYTRRNVISNTTPNIAVDQDQEDLPIALRKGVSECTKHPLYNFLT